MNKRKSKEKHFGLIELSDEELMKLFVLDNNQLAFEVVYKRYFNVLTKYISWLSKDIDLSKDIVQSVFSKLYSNSEIYQLDKKFKTWLYTVAKNKLTNYWRDTKNRNRIVKDVNFLNEAISYFNTNHENRKNQVKEAIDVLSEEHKNVFVLKYSSNLTIKEISEISNCSEGTVKSRLFYAMKKIKEIVKNKN